MRAWWLFLVLAVAGCHAPAAHFHTCAADEARPTRCDLLSRQLAEDSAVELAAHPGRCGMQLIWGTATGLYRAGQDLFGKRLLLPLLGRPDPLRCDRLPEEEALVLGPAGGEADFRGTRGRGLQPADVRLYLDGTAALRAAEHLIDGAPGGIDVLMFMWDADPLGWSLAQRLAAHAGPGCPVRVLADGSGNLIHGPPPQESAAAVNRVLCWLGRQPHVEVLRTRNPLLRLDHRKLIVAHGAAGAGPEGCVAWTGGRNFTLNSFFEQHDLSFTLTGPLADELGRCFEESWEEQGGGVCESKIEDRGIPEAAGCGLSSILYPLSSVSAANAWGRIVGTGPYRDDYRRCLFHAVDHARHHVYLENPYFTDSRLVCKVARARRRGADVRVVLAADSMSKVVDHATRVTANRLLAAGVRVYFYPGLTHVKAASVDGCWAYIGTGNFDSLSLRYNREVGVVLGAGPVITELDECLFQADFRPEWELTHPLPLSASDYACEVLTSLCL